MSASFNCPECHEPLKSTTVGKQVECDVCGATVTVGTEPASPADKARPAAVTERRNERSSARTAARRRRDDDDDEDDLPPPRRRTSGAGMTTCLVVGGVLGGVALLLLVIGGSVLTVLVRAVRRAPAPEQATVAPGPAPAPDPEMAPPNAPDPNEGPPPAGWFILFCSDDPSVWNTESLGERFALPVRRAHSKVRFLRLRRVDTGAALIMPITHSQLAGDNRASPAEGHWWNGTARSQWGARHLGIVQMPSASRNERGLIGLALTGSETVSGSGFGWKTYVDNGQYYCWQGKEIGRTVFEIAVSVSPLSEEEKRLLTANADEGPPPAGWTILFRSDDPADWNTLRFGDKFSIPVGRAHSQVRYLRLKRMDTGQAQIVAVTRAQLLSEPRPVPVGGHWWNGTGRLEWGGRHLGIVRGLRLQGPGERGAISVMNDGWTAYAGSGFGHQHHGAAKDQFYCWEGRALPRTTFEIAVSVGPLTAEETRQLVN
jgi:hypothetical protein